MNVVNWGKLGWGICAAVAGMGLAGCSSTDNADLPGGGGAEQQASGGAANNGSSGAAGGGAMGGARPAGGSGKLSYPGCEHVIVSSLDLYTSDGSEPNAIAAWDDQLYLLTGDGKSQTIRVIEGSSLVEIARVADDDDRIDLTPHTLSVDDRGIFLDGYQDGYKRLIGVPLAGGEGVRIADLTKVSEVLDATFVSDEDTLYFAADGDGGRVLKSAPRAVAKASEPVVITDYTAFYNGLVALGRVGSSVFTVSGGFGAFIAREFPVVPQDPPTHSRSAGFMLKDCTTFAIPPRVVSGDDALYVGCISEGNAQSYIFRLPPAAQWPESEETVELAPVASGPRLDEDSFIVVGKDVYFRDTDANDDDHVYRVSASGGKPTRVLDTHVVHHMASDGKTLFVEGSCGIQALSL